MILHGSVIIASYDEVIMKILYIFTFILAYTASSYLIVSSSDDENTRPIAEKEQGRRFDATNSLPATKQVVQQIEPSIKSSSNESDNNNKPSITDTIQTSQGYETPPSIAQQIQDEQVAADRSPEYVSSGYQGYSQASHYQGDARGIAHEESREQVIVSSFMDSSAVNRDDVSTSAPDNANEEASVHAKSYNRDSYNYDPSSGVDPYSSVEVADQAPQVHCPDSLYMGGNAYAINMLKKSGCQKPKNYNGAW
jgi:hypothetical protein